MNRTYAQQIQPGDILRISGRTVEVTHTVKIEDPDVATLPADWPEWWKRGAYQVHCKDIITDQALRYTLPNMLPHREIELIGTKDDEGHWPICRDCGDIWPCAEIKIMQDARKRSEKVLTQAVDEFEKPFPCHWCARFKSWNGDKRFASERGLKVHLRRCWSNPTNWKLDEWIPTFNDALQIRGGFTPGAASGEYERMARRLAEAVKHHAENGTLPPANEDARVIVEANA